MLPPCSHHAPLSRPRLGARWGVLPASRRPDTAIVNLYSVGDCIPPHIDHHDFVRPFCTLSLLSACPIVFGETLRVSRLNPKAKLNPKP